MDDPRAFYDDLSSDYHLIYADWWRSVVHQGEVLGQLVAEVLGEGPKDVLDCTAGIGTQSLGLALQGHRVVGTDLSEQAILRAQQEAAARGIEATFRVCDARDLGSLDAGPFDVVISADNSLPHLIDSSDLERAAVGMWVQTREPGLLVVTTRDYDELAQSRPEAEGPRTLGDRGARRVVLQLWDWLDDDLVYDVDHIMLTESEEGWNVASRRCRYRALQRAELERAFRRAGAQEMEWLSPTASGFFQPVLRIRRGRVTVESDV